VFQWALRCPESPPVLENFKIMARVYPSDEGFTAAVTALPEKASTLAEVRTRPCDSHQEGITLLDPMTQSLQLELTGRGDSVLGIEFQ
jgi:hypothetical protein